MFQLPKGVCISLLGLLYKISQSRSLNNTHLFSHNPGGQKSKIRVPIHSSTGKHSLPALYTKGCNHFMCSDSLSQLCAGERKRIRGEEDEGGGR